MLDAYELAKEYYPKYWTKSMMINLVKKGKLTKEQYKDVTGEDFPEEDTETK